MNEIPRPGERYRHFKNREYQIIAVATHSETGERMVVYQALYGDYGVWVRPLSMFLEKVDREKYPDVPQIYRFERIAAAPGAPVLPGKSGVPEYRGAQTPRERGMYGSAAPRERKMCGNAVSGKGASAVPEVPERRCVPSGETQPSLHPLVLRFLEADSVEERLEILQKMWGKVGQREIESLYFALDVTPGRGTPEEQLDGLRQYLRMQQRYDASRLRRG